MGNKLFGVDIAGIIHNNISAGLLPVRVERQVLSAADPDNLTGGKTIGTPVVITGRGIWIDYTPSQIDGTKILLNDRKAMIIGNSMKPAGIIPTKGDAVTIEGQTLYVWKLESRDPAAATYTFQCRDTRGEDGQ